jgi:hypothetical protein
VNILHARRAGFGAVIFFVALAALAFHARLYVPGTGVPEGAGTLVAVVLALSAIVTCGVGVALLPGQPAGEAPESLPFANGAHPYRESPFARLFAAPPPRVSARTTVVLVLACMTFTALVVPFALQLPRWLEIEGVLGGWWASWAAVLAVLAYRGRPLDDGAAALWPDEAPSAQPRPVREAEARPSRWWYLADLTFNSEGVVVVLALCLALGVAWLVVELVAPAVFFATWVGLTHAVRRARVSRRRGQLAYAALHGVLWATAYVAPLAVAVALVHKLAGH